MAAGFVNARLKSLRNMSRTHVLLVALTIQSSFSLLITRHARISTPLEEYRPSSATALLTSEVVKLAVSLTFALYEIVSDPKTPDTSTAAGLFGELARAVFSSDTWKMAMPAVLYTLQTSLQYVAASNLDSQTFEATTQLRTLATALFSTMLLGRILSMKQWISLGLLMGGLAAVVYSDRGDLSPVLSMKDLSNGAAFHEARNIWDLKAAGNAAAGQLMRRSATYEGINQDTGSVNQDIHYFVGVTTLATACVAAGLASVYFEKIIKELKIDQTASVWVRSVQLSFYSIWPALLVSLLFNAGDYGTTSGLFTGYNTLAWSAILLHATGGLLIAFVIKHANNVAKEFAIGISVVASSLISISVFGVERSGFYPVGAGFVILATSLYNTTQGDEAKPKPMPPQIRVDQPEKADSGSYFDLESIATPARSPLRTDALSTSRPGTPIYERSARKSKSPDSRLAKREQ